MKSGRAKIGNFQKMRIKNLRGFSELRFRKTRLPNYSVRLVFFCFKRHFFISWHAVEPAVYSDTRQGKIPLKFISKLFT